MSAWARIFVETLCVVEVSKFTHAEVVRIVPSGIEDGVVSVITNSWPPKNGKLMMPVLPIKSEGSPLPLVAEMVAPFGTSIVSRLQPSLPSMNEYWAGVPARENAGPSRITAAGGRSIGSVAELFDTLGS